MVIRRQRYHMWRAKANRNDKLQIFQVSRFRNSYSGNSCAVSQAFLRHLHFGDSHKVLQMKKSIRNCLYRIFILVATHSYIILRLFIRIRLVVFAECMVSIVISKSRMQANYSKRSRKAMQSDDVIVRRSFSDFTPEYPA